METLREIKLDQIYDEYNVSMECRKLINDFFKEKALEINSTAA